MSGTNDKETTNKGYNVVDKRFVDSSETTETETTSETKTEQPDVSEKEISESPPQLTFQNSLRLLLHLLRQQAIVDLGLVESLNFADKTPEFEEVKFVVSLFRNILQKFGNIISQEQGAQEIQPTSIKDMLLLLMRELQTHVYIHIGLVPNPMTNLIVKDFDSAKNTIDLFSFLLDNIKDKLGSNEYTELERGLSDMKINYVKQLGA